MLRQQQEEEEGEEQGERGERLEKRKKLIRFRDVAARNFQGISAPHLLNAQPAVERGRRGRGKAWRAGKALQINHGIVRRFSK